MHSTQLRRCRLLVCLTFPPWFEAGCWGDMAARKALEEGPESSGDAGFICRSLFTEIGGGLQSDAMASLLKCYLRYLSCAGGRGASKDRRPITALTQADPPQLPSPDYPRSCYAPAHSLINLDNSTRSPDSPSHPLVSQFFPTLRLLGIRCNRRPPLILCGVLSHRASLVCASRVVTGPTPAPDSSRRKKGKKVCIV